MIWILLIVINGFWNDLEYSKPKTSVCLETIDYETASAETDSLLFTVSSDYVGCVCVGCTAISFRRMTSCLNTPSARQPNLHTTSTLLKGFFLYKNILISR